MALRSASSEFQAARLDKTARLAGESFAFDEGYRPASTTETGHALMWWSIVAVTLPALAYLGWG